MEKSLQARSRQPRLPEALSQQREAGQPAFAEITSSTMDRRAPGVAVTVRISGGEADIHVGADAVETVLRVVTSC